MAYLATGTPCPEMMAVQIGERFGMWPGDVKKKPQAEIFEIYACLWAENEWNRVHNG